MKKLTLVATLTSALLVPAAALACDGQGKQAEKTEKQTEKTTVRNVTVTDVASWSKGGQAVLLDANSPEFRSQNGVIPGARMLTNFKSYDVSKELPSTKDTKLVFYCANSYCSASTKAAEKALSAGYKDVNVLPDGLLGWKQAGQPTASTPRS